MNTDIRVLVSFWGHPKRKRLEMILGPGATGYLIDLWLRTAQDRPDGILTGWDETDIALAAGWEGDPSESVEALKKTGWLDVAEDGTFLVHDWSEYQGWACGAKARSESARKAAKVRWARSNAKAPTMRPHNESNAPAYAPSPNPSPKSSCRTSSRSDESPQKDKERVEDSIEEYSIEDSLPQISTGDVLELYNDICTKLPKAQRLTKKRQEKIRVRLKENPERSFWEHLFNKANETPFLCGNNKNNWTANLDWLIANDTNMIKVIEGSYDSKKHSGLREFYNEMEAKQNGAEGL